MKLYTRVDTPKRLEKFKKIAIKFDIKWYSGSSVDEYMPNNDLRITPLAIAVELRNQGHLEYGRLSYYKSHDKYVQIKLSQLEMVLEELL